MNSSLRIVVGACLLASGVRPAAGQTLPKLRAWLAIPAATRPALATQPFANEPLTHQQSDSAREWLLADRSATIRATWATQWREGAFDADWKRGTFTSDSAEGGPYTFVFGYHVFGQAPADGRSLYISLHGGGGAPAAVNDQQWSNQIRLYRPAEGVYLVPRAPTNTWNMWHQAYMDDFLNRVIQAAVAFEGVNPNKVYLLGYSAGGDGTYQLAPRLADHWAAAAMMAGHPGDASALPLRNVAFAIYQGDLDSAYHRNTLAAEWGRRLDSLQRADSGGYVHDVHIYPDMPHWMNRRDTAAIGWMAAHVRNPIPTKVVWVQDDVLTRQSYWLSVPLGGMNQGNEVIASYDRAKNRVDIAWNDADGLVVHLNDAMLNLDKPIIVTVKGRQVFAGIVPRTVASIEQSVRSRADRGLVFPAQVRVP